jgi:cell wall-associated NlpC family hydrolase
VQNLFANVGIELPRTSGEQAKYGKAIELKNLAVGDLLFFENRGKVSHVAVYAGNGQIIHSSTSRGVVREPLSDSIMRNFAFVRRVLE